MKYKIIDIGIRAVKTFIQTFIGSIGIAGQFTSVNWTVAIDTALLAAFVSILMNINKLIPNHYKRRKRHVVIKEEKN